ERSAARDQQLPGVHRTALPRTLRERVRARHQPAAGDHQAHRADHRRRCTPERVGAAAAAGAPDGKTVAVVGSGPAGLAAAQQLTRAGHTVVVYEREDRIGGLLRYGIPDFKMEKQLVDARIEQMTAEGTRFRPGVEIGVQLSWSDLRARYDAVLIATGSTVPRELPIPGRDLPGV